LLSNLKKALKERSYGLKVRLCVCALVSGVSGGDGGDGGGGGGGGSNNISDLLSNLKTALKSVNMHI
jgi:hypothetical protein